MPNIKIDQVLLKRYRVVDFIAAGGEGVVYKAYDLKKNVNLAMKVLDIEIEDDPKLAMLFKRGAKALKELSHPNIVPYYGYEQTDEALFLFMGYIDGDSLKGILKRPENRPFPFIDTLVVMKALCAALGYAHINEVVHCDIKPGNVLLDLGGNVFLTDFGIARHADSNVTKIAGAGTTMYMAPEQIREETVTPATDIYALGGVAFEIFTGQKLFRGNEQGNEESQKSSKERIRDAHLTIAPPNPCTINPEIPEALAQVILKALSKEPEDRFETTQQFILSMCEASNIPIDQIPDRINLNLVRGKSSSVIDTNGEDPEPLPLPPSTPEHSDWICPHCSHLVDGSLQECPKCEGGNIVYGKKNKKKYKPKIVIGIIAMVILICLVVSWYWPNPIMYKKVTQTNQPFSFSMTTNTMQPKTSTPTTTTLKPTSTLTPKPSITLTPTIVVGSIKISPADGMQMVYVPEGNFIMGSTDGDNDEKPIHNVLIDAYWIDKFEVTNAQYKKCVEEGICSYPSNLSNFNNFSSQNFPVTYVDWYQAKTYCDWTERRLPTEAEWEKAARGTKGYLYPWGNDRPNCKLANFSGCLGSATNVGSYVEGISPYGAMDFAGNVGEWVNDWYDADYYNVTDPSNPTGPIDGTHKVTRGGGWYYGEYYLRMSFRDHDLPTLRHGNLGFRCASNP